MTSPLEGVGEHDGESAASGWKIREAIAAAARKLSASSQSARLDAELLMAHALGTGREAMLLEGLEREAPASFVDLVARRAAGEPIAYITGTRAFWTIDLAVAPGVLIPRPDTETLIEAAVAHFGSRGPRNILDLGTGSGALLLAALDQWPQTVGLGIDQSEAALAIARTNADRLELAGRASFRRGDWAEDIEDRFDLVLCNPPYVEDEAELPRDVADWEPASALFAGHDGLAAYRAIAPQVRRLIAPGGIACFEIGAGQEQAVTAFLSSTGSTVTSRRDLAGHVRCLVVHG